VGKRGASDGRRMVRIVCGAEYGSDGIEAACRSGARREDPTGPACMVARQLLNRLEACALGGVLPSEQRECPDKRAAELSCWSRLQWRLARANTKICQHRKLELQSQDDLPYLSEKVNMPSVLPSGSAVELEAGPISLAVSTSCDSDSLRLVRWQTLATPARILAQPKVFFTRRRRSVLGFGLAWRRIINTCHRPASLWVVACALSFQ
ncbi:hypothetical protein L915_07111, partial [Phytophthora nicotianae]